MKNQPQHVRYCLIGQGRVVDDLYGSFLSQAHRCHEEMTNLRDISQQAYQLFSAGRDVWQTHCDFVISSLSRLKVPIERFCALLRNPSDSPAALSHHSYPLIVTLYQVDEQERHIKSLISAYRSGCQTQARQMIGQKYEIHCELKKLIYYNEEALQRVERLIDEIYSLECQHLFSNDQCQSERTFQTDNQFADINVDREGSNIIPLYRDRLHSTRATSVNPAHSPCLQRIGHVKTRHRSCVYEDKA